MGSLMSRTWLLRGVAVAVFAVLVGAWAMGFAPAEDTPPPPENVVSPVSPDRSRAPDGKRSTGPERMKPKRAREATPSQAASTESPDTVAEPTDDDPSTSAPTSPDPTSDSPEPSDGPSDSPTRPPQTPSNPPTHPEEECTDLGGVLNCVLEPITDRP